MSETAELTAEEKLYKSWEGKTIAPGGITIKEGWENWLGIAFTDGTKFSLWVARSHLYVEKEM